MKVNTEEMRAAVRHAEMKEIEKQEIIRAESNKKQEKVDELKKIENRINVLV